jgi:hypothetical protein
VNLRLALFLVALDQARTGWEYCREGEKKTADTGSETLCYQTSQNGAQTTEQESDRVFMRLCLLQG